MGDLVRRVKYNGTNQTVYILGPGEKPVPGRVCFTQDEFHWAEKIAGAEQDLGMRNIFWEGVFQMKANDCHYSVFTGWPRDHTLVTPPPKYQPRREHPPGAPPEVAKKYCQEIMKLWAEKPTG